LNLIHIFPNLEFPVLEVSRESEGIIEDMVQTRGIRTEIDKRTWVVIDELVVNNVNDELTETIRR
jgi:hypothetical protein